MTVYKWKQGSRVKANAQMVGEVCEEIASNGELTPTALVDASREESAPLHDLFEWNDATAAEKYRETQAAYIIRSIEVVTNSADPVRAFVPVHIGGESRSYINVELALSEPDTRAEVLKDAMSELESFKRKYRGLKELAGVFKEIERLQKKGKK